MRDMHFKPLTDKERKMNQRLDKINHAPYFTIFLIMFAGVLLFTMVILLGMV